MVFIKFLFAIVLTEAITEVIVKSEIFQPLRAKIFYLGQSNKFFKWFHDLLDCGYCFSVWAGCTVALFLCKDFSLLHPYFDWFILGIVLHRFSNLFHNIMDRIHG